jgi:small multidrug resistance family-3 protein
MNLKPFFITLFLFIITAIAEIVSCHLGYLILKQQKPLWLILPMLVTLAIFVWLLTLHPTATGRVYAAYGGIYIVTALVWLKVVDGVNLSYWDMVGGLVVLLGASIIIFQPKSFF